MKRFVCLLFILGAALFFARADTHIYGGAPGTNQNDKLNFANGVVFDARLSSISLPQVLRTNGPNTGHHRGDVITFSALPATLPNGGPIPGHAAFGAQLAVQVVSVEGPPGGSFAFWEGDGESALDSITFSVPVGTTNGSNYLVISENEGQPATDPYGHIHGRAFTTSLPGTYLVGFRVIDVSSNGTNGSPIHTPSDVLLVRFQAGVRIEAMQLFTNRVTVSFRAVPNISNRLEVIETLGSTNWQPVAALRGNNNLQTITHSNAPTGQRLYRLRQLNNLP
jgi:hypothetical protein